MGRIWIGGSENVACFEQRVLRHVIAAGGAAVPDVHCFAEHPTDGSIWAVSRRRLFRLAEGQFQAVHRPGGKPLKEGICLRFEADGTLWVGTRNAGLLRWRQQAWAAVTSRAGLPSDSMMKMLSKWLPPEPDAAMPEPAPEPVLEAVAREKAERPHLAVYDRAAFLARLTGDESFVRKIEQRFLQQTLGRMETFRNYVVQGEVKPAEALAHKIRGAAANISAEALREAAARMEQAAAAGDTTALQKLLPELEEEWRKLEASLKGCYPPDISPP